MASGSSAPTGSAPARRRAFKKAQGQKETRERVLDVALDLFTERGYAETSLREIAAELGVSKAALYYHFESKGDILLALHLRMHEISEAALDAVEGHERDVDRWRLGLYRLVDLLLANRKLFELHARNHAALEQLQHSAAEHASKHQDLEERFGAMLKDPGIPFETRARLAGAVGAVTNTAMWSGQYELEVADDELAGILRRMVDDLLGGAPGA